MNQLFDVSDQEDSFRQFFLISLLLHASIVIVYGVKTILLPNDVIDFQRAIRVDVVALPDKIDPEVLPLPEQKAELPAKQELKKDTPQPISLEKPKATPVKDTQKKAIEKLKALEAIEKIKNEVAAKNLKDTLAKTAQPKFKGNIITSGNDFTGLSKLKVSDYLDGLMNKVRQNWELPQWLSSAQLKATVVIQIDPRGNVIRSEIHTSSGNKVFDSLCLDAIHNSSPFEIPPDEVREALIMVRFPFQ